MADLLFFKPFVKGKNSLFIERIDCCLGPSLWWTLINVDVDVDVCGLSRICNNSAVGKIRTEPNRTGQDRIRPDPTGSNRIGPDRTRPDQIESDRQNSDRINNKVPAQSRHMKYLGHQLRLIPAFARVLQEKFVRALVTVV